MTKRIKTDLLNLIDTMAMTVIQYHTHQPPPAGLSPKEFEIGLNDNLNEMIKMCLATKSVPIRWAIAQVYSVHHFLLMNPELAEIILKSFDQVFQLTHEAREAWDIKPLTDD